MRTTEPAYFDSALQPQASYKRPFILFLILFLLVTVLLCITVTYCLKPHSEPQPVQTMPQSSIDEAYFRGYDQGIQDYQSCYGDQDPEAALEEAYYEGYQEGYSDSRDGKRNAAYQWRHQKSVQEALIDIIGNSKR